KETEEEAQAVPRSFYRRQLPESSCLAFSSAAGRKLFAEALDERRLQGNMESFFPLAEQFITQDEPAFCGITSLTMILNALAIDPGRLWKGPWRWYHERNLDTCEALDEVKQQGVGYRKLACLARCNGAEAEVREAAADALPRFRATVADVCSGRRPGAHLIVSYDRRQLGQTGEGHHTPVGGYHSRSDMLLVLDVARFK
ncbi:unnamed protein product, partial [Phaeothamnion confervicola]